MKKSQGPRAKGVSEPPQLVCREKIWSNCSSKNAKFKFCNNGKHSSQDISVATAGKCSNLIADMSNNLFK